MAQLTILKLDGNFVQHTRHVVKFVATLVSTAEVALEHEYKAVVFSRLLNELILQIVSFFDQSSQIALKLHLSEFELMQWIFGASSHLVNHSRLQQSCYAFKLL